MEDLVEYVDAEFSTALNYERYLIARNRTWGNRSWNPSPELDENQVRRQYLEHT